mgnify:CR=1 FL=1
MLPMPFKLQAFLTKFSQIMFGLFKKNEVKKLEKQYEALMEKARDVQRSGDLRKYAVLIEESEEILKKIEEAKSQEKK